MPEEKDRTELLAEIRSLQETVRRLEKKAQEYAIERDRTGEAARRAEDRFAEALLNSRHILYRLNIKAGRYDYLSPYIEELTGYPFADFLNFGLDDFKMLMHPEDRDKVFASIEEACRDLRGEPVSLNIEYRLRKANGDYCWLSDSTTIYLNEAGQLEGFVGSAHDITEHKKLDIELAEREERLRTIFDTSHAGIVMVDPQGTVTFANNRMAEMFNCRLSQLIGSAYHERIHPDGKEECMELMRQLVSGSIDHVALERRYIRYDGADFWGYLSGRRQAAEDGSLRALVGIITDITELKEMEAEKKKMQDELLKVQKLESLGVLAGGIAHDFNNILTGILGNLSFARLQLGPSHTAIAKRLEECEKAALQASKLTQQLLTFARGGEPVKKLLDPGSLIREAASFVLHGSNVRCLVELADDLWCIEADGAQINQALHNVLINAAQAMPGGGEIALGAVNETLPPDNRHNLPAGDYLRIDVRDRGCGIPAENLGKIFDPYFTTKPGGSGLGLASTYSVIKRHGGSIEVSSTVGVGTDIAIRIPAVPAKEEGEATIEKQMGPAACGRLLIMDDEEFIRDIATEILEFAGYEVSSCSDGKEAVELFKWAWEGGAPFAVVILDLTVPGGMGGKEAAALIRGIDPNAVLIVTSGYSSDPVVADYRHYGFSGAILKPFDAHALAAEVERVQQSVSP